jgi:hypothetical protein
MHMSQEAPEITIDLTEYAAVTVLLRAVIASTAAQHEMLGLGTGQAWINGISAACQTAVLGADISADPPAVDVEAFRRKTMEHINRMLAGLAPETGTAKANN